MNSPAVSVVIPVYNPGEGIHKCIHMLRTQTLSNIEMLFVDDCGTDSSMDAVHKAAAEDSRIRILTNPENIGAGASRNRGLEEAIGEYLSFIDPDDYPEQNFLELLYQKAVTAKPDIVKGERRLIREDGTEIREQHRVPLNVSIRFGLQMGGQIYDLFSYNHWSAIYRRSFLIENNIRYGLTGNSQDTTFLLRVGKAAKTICFEDNAIYNYVSRGQSRMRDFSHIRLQNELDAFDDQIRDIETADPDKYSFYKYIIGKILYLLRIQAFLLRQNEPEANWFNRCIHEKVTTLPWLTQLMEINRTVRAFVLFGVNLTLMPYRAQGVEGGIEEWLAVVDRIMGFLIDHPEESNLYGWMLRVSFGNVLSRLNDSVVTPEERRKASSYLRSCLSEMSQLEKFTAGDPLIRLFIKAGVNLKPLQLTVRIFGQKYSMKVTYAFFEKRDRERNSSAAPAKPGTKA